MIGPCLNPGGYFTASIWNRRSYAFQESIEVASGDGRQLFSIVMGLLGRKKINPILEEKTENELAEGFADYFFSKIQKIIDSLNDVPKYRPKGKVEPKFMNFNLLAWVDISKIITSSKPTTCSSDPVPSALIKKNIDICAPVLTRISDKLFITAWSFFTITGKLSHFIHYWKNKVWSVHLLTTDLLVTWVLSRRSPRPSPVPFNNLPFTWQRTTCMQAIRVSIKKTLALNWHYIVGWIICCGHKKRCHIHWRPSIKILEWIIQH